MNRRSWALFGAMCLVWGIPYLLIKVAVRSVSPPDLVFARTGIGAVLLLPVVLWRKELPKLLPYWRPLLAYTAAELAVTWLFLSDAEQHLPSSLSGLLVAAVPFVSAVIGRFTGQPRLGRVRLAGLTVGVGGVVVLLGLDLRGAHASSLLEMAVVVLGYALGPSIAAHKLSGAPQMAVVAASLALCCLAYAPWVLTHLPAHLPAGRPAASIIALGVICTALAFVLFFRLIEEIGPSRSVVITYVNPAVAVVLGVAFLHEHFGWSAGLGFVLILLGSYVSTAGDRLVGRWRLRRRADDPAVTAR